MLIVYGTDLCRDCVLCKANFDHYGIAYEFIDITGNIRNLKKFLAIRDREEIFLTCKERGSIGLPTLQREDGSFFFEWEKVLEEKGYQVLENPTKSSCSVDGKGC